MDSPATDNVAGSCSIIVLNARAINHPHLAGRDERACPRASAVLVQISQISLVSVPSKDTQEIDFQDHSLAVGTVVPSEVITHIITAQGLQNYGLNTILFVLATNYTTFHHGKDHVFF